METALTLSPLVELPTLPPEIKEAGPNGELVLFVGAGISKLLKMPGWAELASKALAQLETGHHINFAAREQLEKEISNPRTKLSIALEIARQKGYSLDLTKFLGGFSEGGSIYKTINDIGSTCVTTNYDELLAPRFVTLVDGSGTSKPSLRINDREQFFARHLNDPGVVVHLHGSVSSPTTMIVSTRDYLEHYDHKNVQHFLGELFETKTVLFLGYGLEESEVLEHILRRGRVGDTGNRRRFSLHGFMAHQGPLYEQLGHYYRTSFGVHLVGYVKDNLGYHQQEKILAAWAPKIQVQKTALADEYARIERVLGHG